MEYYIDGKKVGFNAALVFFTKSSNTKGYDIITQAEVWRERCSEEGRDTILDFTDGRLEIIAD